MKRWMTRKAGAFFLSTATGLCWISAEATFAQSPAANPPSEIQSEIQRKLAEMYGRDGRLMPTMNMEDLPDTLPNGQQPVMPLPQHREEGGFFNRLFNRRSRAVSSQPAQPPVPHELPADSIPHKTTYSSAPRPVNVSAVQVAPNAARQVAHPLASAANSTRLVSGIQAPVNRPAPAVQTATETRPAAPVVQPDNPFAATAHPLSASALPNAAPKVVPVQPVADVDNPFEPLPQAEARPEVKPQAAPKAVPVQPVAAVDNPFEPLPQAGPQSVTKPQAAPSTVGLPTPQSSEAPQADVKTAARPIAPAATTKPQLRDQNNRRLQARSELPGFQGFCPVTLRDRRELADALPDFRSDWEGTTYGFASAEAKLLFDAQPEKYVPANAGHDVTLLAQAGQPTPGSLQHAVWFRGQLYLFHSAATLNRFLQTPETFIR